MTSPAGRSFGTRTKKAKQTGKPGTFDSVLERRMAEDASRCASYQKREVDPLTIAYIAIGAKAALDAYRDKAGEDFNLDRFSGESGFIYECIQHADMVDTIGVDADGVYDYGVHCYDISEPFGEQLAQRLLDGVFEPDVQAIAEGLLAELVVKHGRSA